MVLLHVSMEVNHGTFPAFSYTLPPLPLASTACAHTHALPRPARPFPCVSLPGASLVEHPLFLSAQALHTAMVDSGYTLGCRIPLDPIVSCRSPTAWQSPPRVCPGSAAWVCGRGSPQEAQVQGHCTQQEAQVQGHCTQQEAQVQGLCTQQEAQVQGHCTQQEGVLVERGFWGGTWHDV